MIRVMLRVFVVLALVAVAVPAAAQELKIAVIDVQRVVTESDPGKEALGQLKQIQDRRVEEGRALNDNLEALKSQYNKGQFTLSEERLADLRKQIEDTTIALQRFQDDVQRELDEARRRALDGLEQQIMPIIDAVGKEKGLTLIFNKFQSGLVYADETVDITEQVIRRFNTTQ